MSSNIGIQVELKKIRGIKLTIQTFYTPFKEQQQPSIVLKHKLIKTIVTTIQVKIFCIISQEQ